MRERQRDIVVNNCQHPFGYNWWREAAKIILQNREIFLPGTTLFCFIIVQFKNFYDYTIKSSLFVYLNNIILKIQTLTQANSCSVAVESSFKTWRRYVNFGSYMLNFFSSFNNWILAPWIFRMSLVLVSYLNYMNWWRLQKFFLGCSLRMINYTI